MPRRLRLLAPPVVANAIAATAMFWYQNVLTPAQVQVDPGRQRESLVAFVAFAAVVFPISFVLGRRILTGATAWQEESRPANHADRRAALRAPLRIASMTFRFWLLATVTFSLLSGLRGDPLSGVARDTVATLLGGLVSAALSFLLVEWVLRPTVAAALASGAPPRSTTIGVGARILLAWAMGSGIPLLAIAAAQVRPAPTSPAALLFLAAVGLGVGGLMLLFAARAVVAPVDGVRRALERVQAGDLDVRVPVDDGGEIGQLQAGVNRMVEGLRERRLLEELFGRHVGTEVARRALAQGSELGGEQRTASALFVDLIGSTATAERHAPAEVVGLLNTFFGIVVAIVGEEGGWVNKFEGDGALCVFGAPSAQDDHPARALRAARRLQAALLDVHPAAIGVSSGVVVAGNVGAAERLEYTVIGDPVNEAARLSEAAKERPERLLASGSCIDAAVEEAGYWRPVAMLHLRGRSTPTCAYAPAP